MVSTSRSFLKADLQKTDIFIFDEAHACGNNQTTQDILNNLRGSRIFGFTATPKGRSDKADRLIEAVFGQKLVDFGYEDAKEAGNVTPIEVQVYSVPGRIEASKSRFGNAMTQNRRRFYWRNDIRNNLIRAVADRVPEDEQLLIMVDTVEHLIRLGAMMPGFALVCGDGHDLAEEARRMKLDLSKNILGDTKEVYNELADRFSKGLLKRVIATYRWGTAPVNEKMQQMSGTPFDLFKGIMFVAQDALDAPLKGTEAMRKEAFGRLFNCQKYERLRDILQEGVTRIAPRCHVDDGRSIDDTMEELRKAEASRSESEASVKAIEQQMAQFDLPALYKIVNSTISGILSG